MSAKVSSKKAQEGINNRLQVVMRSGKYTVRSFRSLERGSSSLRVQDDDDDDDNDFGGPDGFVFATTTTTTTTSRRSLLQISLISFFLSFFLSLFNTARVQDGSQNPPLWESETHSHREQRSAFA